VPRRLHETVQTNLRAPESLRRKLEREAKKHGVSYNKECLLRLEASFQKDAAHDLDEVTQDMRRAWLRYGDRFLLLSLEDELAQALAKSTDPTVATLAAAWLATKKGGQQS
jgi:Arc-like DNA binding domain